MPKSGFGDEYFHKTIFDKASAYLFHLVKNHPFVDGNKRIGFALKHENQEKIYDFVLKVASSNSISKEAIAKFLEENSQKIKNN